MHFEHHCDGIYGKLGYGRLVTWLPRDIAMRLNIRGSLFLGVDVGFPQPDPGVSWPLRLNPQQRSTSCSDNWHLHRGCASVWYVNAGFNWEMLRVEASHREVLASGLC